MTKEEAIIERYNLLWRQEGFWCSDEFMEKLINHPKVIEEYNKRRLEELIVQNYSKEDLFGEDDDK